MNIGLLIGILSGFLWGLNDVFTNLFSSNVGITNIHMVLIFALSLAFLQDAFSSLGIMTYHRTQGNFKQKLKSSRSIIWIVLFAAISAGPLGMVAGIMGIAYAGPVYAGVITSCYPIVALILAAFLLRMKPSKLKLFGMLLSVFAVVCISIQGLDAGVGHHNILIGMCFATVAMLGWGVESVMFTLASNRTQLTPSWILGVRQFFSAGSYLIILVGYAIFSEGDVLRELAKINNIWFMLACVLSASFSYLTYYNTIRKIGPGLGTVFNATFVFWAAVISAAIGISVLEPLFWAWAVLLICGIACATKEKRGS